MAKLTLSSIQSNFQSMAQLNANFDAIKAAVENTLSLDGSTPNAMQAELDMNGHRIINAAAPIASTDVMRLADLGTTLEAAYLLAGLEDELIAVAAIADDIEALTDGAVFSVNTIAALRAAPIEEGAVLQPLGYYAKGDTGGGPIRVAATAPVGGLTDNGGSIIKPLGSVGDNVAEGSLYWAFASYWDGSVEAFGASPQGTAAVNTACINAAHTTGLPLLFQSGSTYLINPLAYTSATDFSSTGSEAAILYCSTTPDSPILSVTGTAKGTGTTTAAIDSGDSTFSTALTGISVGDLVQVKSAVLWPSDDRGELYEGQLVKVVSISGTTHKIESAFALSFASGVAITVYSPVPVSLSNLTFQREKYNGSSRGVVIDWSDGAKVENVNVTDCTRTGLLLANCYRAVATNTIVRGANLIVSGTLGYGVNVAQSYGCIVEGTQSYECRRGVDIGGISIPSIACIVRGATAYGGGVAEDGSALWPLAADPNVVSSEGVGSHGSSFGTLFENCTTHNCRVGIRLRGRKETVRNVQTFGNMLYPMHIHWAAQPTIEGVSYSDFFDPDVTAAAVKVRPDYFAFINANDFDFTSPLTFKGCSANKTKKGFLLFDGNSGVTIDKLHLLSNRVSCVSDAPGSVSMVAGNSSKLLANYVDDGANYITAPSDHTILKFLSVTLEPTGVNSVHQMAPNSYRVSIEDDDVVKIPVGFNSGQIIVQLFPWSINTNPRGTFGIRHESATAVTLGDVLNTEIAATELTGTTGTDAKATLSFAGDKLYVENRTGVAAKFLINIIF